MSEFQIRTWVQSSVLYVYSQRRAIDTEPEYQRQSDVWTIEKKQLLVDSVLNGFDIPKFYMHEITPPRREGGRVIRHAIVDGKQRLEALWDFIDGRFALDAAFEYLPDPTVRAAGFSYAALSERYPELKIAFDGTTLAIISISTDDIELIEEMFSRLNEAAPLNAAEKRNAFGGPLPAVIRRIAKDQFFTDRLPFTNKRYRHYDTAAKFLYIEQNNSVVDTKKVYLDEFVREFKGKTTRQANSLARHCSHVLDGMSKIFVDHDRLLQRVGMLTVYYHLVRLALNADVVHLLSRDQLEEFERQRSLNREVAEANIAKADYDLLEFDRLNQTPNDEYAIRLRLATLIRFLVDEYGIPDIAYQED